MLDRIGLTVADHIASDYASRDVATIGENLKKIRGGRDQGKIAERMGVGQGQLSNWETGRYTKVTAPKLIALAKAYDCSVEAILDGVDGYERRDLTSHRGDQKSNPPERGVDVPASPAVEGSGLESQRYKELLSATEEIADRLLGLVTEHRALETDRSATPVTAGVRKRARKAG